MALKIAEAKASELVFFLANAANSFPKNPKTKPKLKKTRADEDFLGQIGSLSVAVSGDLDDHNWPQGMRVKNSKSHVDHGGEEEEGLCMIDWAGRVCWKICLSLLDKNTKLCPRTVGQSCNKMICENNKLISGMTIS